MNIIVNEKHDMEIELWSKNAENTGCRDDCIEDHLVTTGSVSKKVFVSKSSLVNNML